MRILSIARDQEVAQARESALKNAGFDVMSARDFRELTNLCKRERFQLAIIGHAFDPDIKRAVAGILHECKPTPAILEIFEEEPVLENTSAALGSTDVQDLVRQVSFMAAKVTSRSA